MSSCGSWPGSWSRCFADRQQTDQARVETDLPEVFTTPSDNRDQAYVSASQPKAATEASNQSRGTGSVGSSAGRFVDRDPGDRREPHAERVARGRVAGATPASDAGHEPPGRAGPRRDDRSFGPGRLDVRSVRQRRSLRPLRRGRVPHHAGLQHHRLSRSVPGLYDRRAVTARALRFLPRDAGPLADSQSLSSHSSSSRHSRPAGVST